jgi:hypothetical protein
MTQRAMPTRQYVTELTGGNQGLIESLHHGLAETPSLRAFYPFLNLNELVAFAASSWKSRDLKSADFAGIVEKTGDAYQIFNEVFKTAFPWLRQNKIISPELTHLDIALNPFNGKKLAERLDSVPAGVVPAFLNELSAETNKWVFECQYDNAKRAQNGSNLGIRIMKFQNVYPKSGRIVPAYVTAVARILYGYPRQFEPLEQPRVESAPDKPQQGALFR